MKDKEPPLPFPPQTQQMSIIDLIQIRVALGNKDQVQTPELVETRNNLDKIIVNFSRSLKGN